MLGPMQESLGTCARCGEPLPADARFCPNCGAPVAALSTEERKVVTVMFADLVGSTKLSTRLDPERFRQVTATFFGAVSEELESLRGRAEKFVGDAVMAVWGVPHAHEDDALRAVRAGLSIKDRVSRLASSLSPDETALATLERVSGTSIEALERELRAWAREEY